MGCRFLLCLAVVAFRGPLAAGLIVRKSEQVPNATAFHDALHNHSSNETKGKGLGRSINEDSDNLRPCLDDKRIIFVGPSTSRSDYFALTFFAEYGRWPDTDEISYGPSTGTPGKGPNPLFGPTLEYGLHNVGRPQMFASPSCTLGTAESYLWYSNSIYNGHEMCDCYKNDPTQKFQIADLYNQTENRIYINQNAYTGRSTMIAYFQWFGDIINPRGSVDFSPLTYLPLHLDPPKAIKQQCPVGQFKGHWDWTLRVQYFISNFVKALNPTHLVVDAAYWPTNPANTAFWNEMSVAGANAVLASGGTVFWRTVPLRNDYPIAEPSGGVNTQTFLSKGWKIFDASGMIKTYRGGKSDDEIFFDTVHLRPHSESHLMWKFLQTHVCPLSHER